MTNLSQTPSALLPQEQALLDAIVSSTYIFDATNAAQKAAIAGVDRRHIAAALESIGFTEQDCEGNLKDRSEARKVLTALSAGIAASALIASQIVGRL